MQNSFTIATKSVPNDTLENTLNRLFVGYNQSQMSDSMDAVERTQVADDFLQIQQIIREVLAQLPQ
jgi:Holliday junction resolvasome RuvABC DNA-binding subunit